MWPVGKASLRDPILTPKRCGSSTAAKLCPLRACPLIAKMPQHGRDGYMDITLFTLRAGICLLALGGLDYDLLKRFIYSKARNGKHYDTDTLPWETCEAIFLNVIAPIPAARLHEYIDETQTPWPRALLEATRFHRNASIAAFVRLRNRRHGAVVNNAQMMDRYEEMNQAHLHEGTHLNSLAPRTSNGLRCWRNRFRSQQQIRYGAMRLCEPQTLASKREKARTLRPQTNTSRGRGS